MTDKQIIIDGVDVSGCEHFSGTYAKECKAVYANSGYKELHDLKCNKSPNCYYKQLKAKEQECERLKGLCNGLDTTIDNYTNLIELRNQQLDQLKAENENWQNEYWKLEQGNDFLAENNSRLKQTLTEIKEIAEKAAKCLYVTKSDDYTDGYRWLGSIILQKISEVENDEITPTNVV